jgi:hypothetical protein
VAGTFSCHLYWFDEQDPNSNSLPEHAAPAKSRRSRGWEVRMACTPRPMSISEGRISFMPDSHDNRRPEGDPRIPRKKDESED